jgi:hypothetical protein
VPYLKASNVQISASEEEKAKLYSMLQNLDYAWFTHIHDSSSFAVAPLTMQSDLSLLSFEPVEFETIVTETESAPVAIGTQPIESQMNELRTGEEILEEAKDILEDSGTEQTIARENESHNPKLVDVEFRAKRIFTPNSGRPLTKLRKIDPEGGSQDFQWNVPSK